jgi:hypothetical protein
LCIEDFDLNAEFYYANPDTNLYKSKWCATEAKYLYVLLQKAMLDKLKASLSSLREYSFIKLKLHDSIFNQNASSKFTLVHNVWTTKGSRYGFIGSSVAFINDNWEFQMCQLSLKLVSWFHRGKWLAQPLANVLHKHELYPKICITFHNLKKNHIKIN